MEPGDLLALARKYRTIGAMRRARDRDGALAAGAELRALAREFPGALRELDVLALDDVDARGDALERAATSDGARPWMEWMHAYHAAMRAALYAKPRLSALPAADAEALASAASTHAGIAVDAAFVRAVASPRDRRLNVVVFDWLSAKFAVSAETIREALFPARGGGRQARGRLPTP